MNTLSTIPAVAWRRIGAALIDWWIAYMASAILLILPLLIAYASQRANHSDADWLSSLTSASQPSLDVILAAIFFVVYWLYSAWLESSIWQATIGKRILGLWVTDANGGRVNFASATIRAWTKMVCGSVPLASVKATCFYAIGVPINLGMVLLTNKHQGLHDKVMQTFVVQRKVERARIMVDRRTYNISGRNVVVTGDNPVFMNLQVGDDNSMQSLSAFTDQLERLRCKIEEQPASNDRDVAISILKAAESDAKQGDTPKMRERLKMLGERIGKWVLDFAVDVGSNLVAEALIRIAGIKP